MKSNAERFWKKVVKSDFCWTWTACIEKNGYGRFGERLKDGTYRSEWAHIFAYKTEIGPIPKGKVLDHIKCDNRKCVRPSHLRPTTIGANVLRGNSIPAQNSRKKACKHGHEFSEENTYSYRSRNGYTHRQCVACNRIREAKRIRRKAA